MQTATLRKADGSRWLQRSAITRLLPVGDTTLSDWEAAGVIRVDRRVTATGKRFTWVNVEDVLDLLTTPPGNGGPRRRLHDADEVERKRVANEISLATAHNHRQPWTVDDIIIAVTDDGRSDAEVAAALGRTIAAVQDMRDRYWSRGARVFNRDELEERLAEVFARETDRGRV